MSLKNWFKFLALGLIWGSSFFWIKIGLQEVGHFTVVFFRVFFAAVGLVLFFILSCRHLPRKYWWVYLVLGFFNVMLPFALVTWAETRISSGMASILNSTQPLATMVIAAIFIREESFTKRRVLGLVLGISGILILMSNKIGGGSANQAIGIIAMVIAVLCYGSSAVFARLNNSGLRPEDQALGQMLFGLVMITPLVLTFESPFILPVKPVTYFAFAFLGLLGSFFAGITWYGLINEIGPSRASMVMFMAPFVGVILGALALHEKVDWRLVAGGLLILAAIIIVNTNKQLSESLVPIENEKYEG